MWDIKPGDEVVCVTPTITGDDLIPNVHAGEVYRVREVYVAAAPCRDCASAVYLKLENRPPFAAYTVCLFRKVHKRRKGDGSAIELLRDIARRESMPAPQKPKREKA